jgi:hypothetical protein
MRAVVLAALFPLWLGMSACGGNDCQDNGEGSCSGDLVCSRTSECLLPSEVHLVRVTWTVRGQPASVTTCTAHPDLYVMFYGVEPNDVFGFAPVPCDAGRFTIDRLPKRFVGVELGVEGGNYKLQRSFDAQGNAAFDLMP